MTSLTLRPLSDFKGLELEQYLEYIRKTRNASKQYMTRNQETITPEVQRHWYENISDNVIPYILIKSEHGTIFYPCGYGLIIIEDKISKLTGVIDESDRGKGYGRKLFSFLIEEAKKKTNKISLEVLISNQKAFNLYKSLGFVVKNQNQKTIFMDLENDSTV